MNAKTPKRPVSLQEIADAAGVHRGTASRALNPATVGKVNPETAAAILKIAQKLQYRPNPIARGLRTSRSMSIGVLIADLTNPFYPPLVRGIDDALRDQNYVPLLANTDNDPERELDLLRNLRDRQVDGLIIATARVKDPFITALAAEGFPAVLVSRTVKDLDMPSVTVNDKNAIELAVNHLVSLGHRNIGHIAGPMDVMTGVTRKSAFISACRKAKVASYPIVGTSHFSLEQGKIAAKKLMENHELTAIIGANDLIALGCIDYLTEQGLKCPGDMSVVGINDMDYLELIAPPLTTVNTQTYQMGLSAAQVLLSILSGTKSSNAESRILQPKLIVRKSTARPKK